jgi:polysaccharide deacetylase family protein (PEP-CTERM system associated)
MPPPVLRTQADSIASPNALPTVNALTVDVEDYFHVSGFDHCVERADWHGMPARVGDNTRHLLDLFARVGVRATFFVLGWVAERDPALVRAIARGGHEVGCHSYWHRRITTQTPGEFRADLCQARDILQGILGTPVTAYRAPTFSVTKASEWALDILAEEGFTLDSSIYPVYHDRYGLPGTPLEPHPIERPAGLLWEFPPPVWRLCRMPLPVGGGGYFRLYPYKITQLALRNINAAGRPFAFYLHPWEIDPEQPRLGAGLLRSFRHYLNLGRTLERLCRLLDDFAFDTLTASLACYRGIEETSVAA